MSIQQHTPEKSIKNGLLNQPTTLHLRFNPKLYFTLSLMARYQGRTVSNFIEQLIKEAANTHAIKAIARNKSQNDCALFGKRLEQTLRTKILVDRIWSPEPSECFALMALHLPNLLTDTEESLWHWIKGKPYFWRHFRIPLETLTGKVVGEETWPLIDQVNLRRDRLRHYWPMFEQVLEGKEPVDSLRFLVFTEVGKKEGVNEQPEWYPYAIQKIVPPRKKNPPKHSQG